MRKATLVSLVLVVSTAGCMSSMRARLPGFGAVAAIRDRLITTAAVNVLVASAVTVASAQPVEQAPVSTDQPTDQPTEDAPPADPPPEEAAPAAAPAPVAIAMPVTVVRHTAAPHTIFALRYQLRGGQSRCEAHATNDECSASCTRLLRPWAMRADAGTNPEAVTNCTCVEQAGGC